MLLDQIPSAAKFKGFLFAENDQLAGIFAVGKSTFLNRENLIKKLIFGLFFHPCGLIRQAGMNDVFKPIFWVFNSNFPSHFKPDLYEDDPAVWCRQICNCINRILT